MAYISNKQIGVLYGAVKRGDLKMPLGHDNGKALYNYSPDVYFIGSAWKENHSIEFMRAAVTAVFEGRMEDAQNDLDIAFYYYEDFEPKGTRFGGKKGQLRSMVYRAVYGSGEEEE